MKKYYLEPKTYSFDSYDKKAYVVEEGRIARLYSYNKFVCEVDRYYKEAEIFNFNEIFFVEDCEKYRFMRLHISDFLCQEGFRGFNKQEMYLEYTEEGRTVFLCKSKEEQSKAIELKKVETRIAFKRKKREALKAIRKEVGPNFSDAEIEALFLEEL